MSETDYQRGWREGAEVMRKALAQAFLEHAGEVGQTIHRRAIWLERAEATKRLAGLRAPDDSAQPPDLARKLAAARAALAECVRVMVQSDAEHDEGIGDDEWQAAIATGRAALGEGDAS